MKPWVAVVGGFLGAGKTTLILAAARMLHPRGVRAAVVMNDQGDDIVDTHFARESGLTVGEVTGGCFCCRYGDLAGAVDALQGFDVIFAEPVGSCTDLAATVMERLRVSEYRLAPYTVVLDPARRVTDANVEFLMRNQLAEADIVCARSPVSGSGYRHVDAKSGMGVAEWLDEIFSGTVTPGAHRLNLDYARYGAAETALSWLDLRATLRTDPALSPALVVGPLLDRLDAALEVLHMKIVDRTTSGVLKAAIVDRGGEPQADGDLTASPATKHEILLNIRALDDPAVLERAVREALPTARDVKLRCFRPNPPVDTRPRQ